MNKKNDINILVTLILILIVINYSWINTAIENFFDESETGVVERVIDADTVIIDGESVRLLGINAPERGEEYYNDGKEFLENLVLNETVTLRFEKERYDKYRRKLSYIYIGGENINQKIVKEGYANIYFPAGKTQSYNDFKDAWKYCTNSEKNICKKSNDFCSKCLSIQDLNVEDQSFSIYNSCDRSCDLDEWEIKDEGRKKYIFEDFELRSHSRVSILIGEGKDTNEKLYWEGEDYVWTESGDTLFLRDSSGKLVLWESY